MRKTLAVLRPLLTSKEFLWGIVMLGLLLRGAATALIPIGFDAQYYVAMGRTFSQTGEFLLPWGDTASAGIAPAYSHHFSPLWPILLGAVFALFGYGVTAVKLTSLATGLLTLLVAYLCTKDLYGRSTALAVTAVLAVFPELILDVGRAYSENLTMALFVLTFWGILKSLRSHKYMIFGGLFAGLAFLSRAGLGYFFILAGLGGLAWRFRYMKWDVFRDRSYLAAIAIFALFVGGWSLRNIARFGFPNWDTSAYIDAYTSRAMSDVPMYIVYLALTLVFFAIILGSIAAFFGEELVASAKNFRSEEESGLWLGVVLVPAIAAFIVAALAQLEAGGGQVFWLDRIRYIVFAIYPLLLMPLRRIEVLSLRNRVDSRDAEAAPARERATKRRAAWAVLVLSSLAFCAAFSVVWLIPMFILATTALFTHNLNVRHALLLVSLVIVAAEVATSGSLQASQAAVDYVTASFGTQVVAVDGPQALLYEVSTYAASRGLRVVDLSNLAQATVILSANFSATFLGFSRNRTFSDVRYEGIVQGLADWLLGKPASHSSPAIVVFHRS